MTEEQTGLNKEVSSLLGGRLYHKAIITEVGNTQVLRACI